MGCRCIPYQFMCFLWLESSVRTLLKTTTDDRVPTGRIKAQARSKSFLMHETCPTYLHLAPSPQLQFARKCSYFVCQLENSCHFPLKREIEFIEQPEYVIQVSQFCDSFLVTCVLKFLLPH